MSLTFNLVDKPWIPCVTAKGTTELRGLFQTLAEANQYAELRDSSPLVTTALHRLLLAVLHRVFGPESPDAWADLWQNGLGRFDADKLAAYLKAPTIYHRLDLFDDEHPFYQTASLPLGPRDKKTGRPKFVKPVWKMAHELAYSDSMNLFAHFTDSDWEMRPPGEAARWLVALQAFALGGTITREKGMKPSADAGHLVKSAVVLAKGDNLFQTLMLNLIHYSAEDESPFAFNAETDRPVWERDGETKQEDRRYDGYLDMLTWQSRQTKLVAEQDSSGTLLGVSGVVIMSGFELPEECWRYNYETMVGYIRAKDAKGKQDPWPPLGFRLGKDLWRDSHALFQTVAETCQRPRTVSWVDDLRQLGHLDRRQIQLDVAGLCADQAKIFLWRHETLPVPLAYLDKDQPELMESLKEIIRLARRVAEVLNDAVSKAATTALKPAKGDSRLTKTERDATKRAVQSLGAEPLFWSRMEAPFRRRLEELPGDHSHRARVIQQWFTDTLQPAARDAYRRTAGELEDSSRALRAAVSGEAVLERGLARIVDDCKFVADTATWEMTYAATRS